MVTETLKGLKAACEATVAMATEVLQLLKDSCGTQLCETGHVPLSLCSLSLCSLQQLPSQIQYQWHRREESKLSSACSSESADGTMQDLWPASEEQEAHWLHRVDAIGDMQMNTCRLPLGACADHSLGKSRYLDRKMSKLLMLVVHAFSRVGRSCKTLSQLIHQSHGGSYLFASPAKISKTFFI